MPSQEEELRYERKFFVLGASLAEMEACVKRNPGLFSAIYYERAINNIYLDTPSRAFYFENVHGFSNRTKARIRWYGDLTGFVARPVLEFKIKKGLLGLKKFFPLRGFRLDEDFESNDLRALLRESMPLESTAQTSFLEAALINRYRRRYYLSADQLYRITIDFDLQFYGMHPWKNSFLARSSHPTKMVLELKYSQAHHDGADRIAAALPFRLTRMSKYVLGVECIYGL